MKVNERVPDFETKAFHNNEVISIRSADYRGKWLVILFYPADFTFICPTELEEAANMYEEFKKLDAEVVSVSTDTVFVHKAWHDSSPSIQKIRFPMLADPSARICKEFGTYIDGEGLSFRATFIIDPDGVVKFMEMHDNSIGRSVKEILRKLQAAKFVRENNGLVCPVNWEPGKKTLKPGLDLVGRI
ncbi:redoxin domain-containing protein [Candidatus Woesearchaeota archaeon]|nr:redoxin domain-containing protein [Candidatus Woesearchaeota archaeon]